MTSRIHRGFRRVGVVVAVPVMLLAAGVEFIAANDSGAGVKLRKAADR